MTGQAFINGLTIYTALKRACQCSFGQVRLPECKGCGGPKQAKKLDFYLIA